ncbi:MAG: hypothetical protein ACI33K_08385 [Clostridiaceae bacterium]
MIKRKGQKVALVAVVMAAAVAALAGSYAWLTAEADVTNLFTTGDKNYDGVILERVNNEVDFTVYRKSNSENPNVVLVDNAFKPGDTNKKEVKFKNTGDYDSMLRIKLTPEVEQWFAQEEKFKPIHNSLDKVPAGNDGPIIIENWNGPSFSYKGEGDNWKYNEQDGYYYYKHIFNVAEETPLILKSISFSGQAGNEHQKINYSLLIEMETVQMSEGNQSISAFSGVDSVVITGDNINWSFK